MLICSILYHRLTFYFTFSLVLETKAASVNIDMFSFDPQISCRIEPPKTRVSSNSYYSYARRRAKYDLDQAKIFMHIKRGLCHKIGQFWLDNFLRSLQSDWLSAKILVLLTAALPHFLSLLFVDVAADIGSWMFLSRIFCTLMINMLKPREICFKES